MDNFKFCTNCGEKVTGGKNFCPKCGHKMETEQQYEMLQPEAINYGNIANNEKSFLANFFSKKINIAIVAFAVILLSVGGIFGYKFLVAKPTDKSQPGKIAADKSNSGKTSNQSKDSKTDGLKKVNVKINQIDNQSFPLIKLYVSLTDSNDVFIENVPLDYFQIREKAQTSNDYVMQKIQSVGQLKKSDELNINMVMDTSGSMNDNSKIQNAKTAAENFINIVNGTDQLEILEFNDYVRTKCNFTSDKNALVSAVKQLYAGGQTALYDAIYTAIVQTSQKEGAKCVIVFTDGLNNMGTKTKQDVIDLAKKTGIPVYTIGIGNEVQSDFSDISAQTGGNYVNTPGTKELEGIYNNIFKVQKNQYVITYTSSNPVQDTNWRNIELSLSNNSKYLGTTNREFVSQVVKPTLITVDAGKVNDIIKANGISGGYSLVIKDLSSGAVSSFGEVQQRMPASALINVPVTLAVADQIKSGKLSLDSKIPFVYSVDGRGKFTKANNGELHTVNELLQIMMNYSDNNCTNTFLSHIGINEVNNIIRKYGFTQTEIQLPLNTKDGGKENWSTCEEISRMLELLYSDSLPIGSAYMNANFRIQDTARKSGILKYLPENINIINHNGIRDTLYNEIAFIGAGTGGKKYILTIMSCNSPQEKLTEAAARLSEYIYSEMTK